MKPEIYTYDGHAINDTTNYLAWFDRNANSFFKQADGPSNELKRANNTPVIGNIDPQSKLMRIVISPRGTFTSQIDTLNQWFDTHDRTLKQLIIKDKDDSDRQWYVMARPEGQPAAYFDTDVVYTLRVPDPIWRTVTLNTSTWTITGTPSTKDVTILGNRPSFPIFKVKPTAAKSGGFAEVIFRGWYNPVTDKFYSNVPFDITNDAWDTAALVSDTSVSNQINQGGGISAVATSIPIDTSVGGGLPTTGGMCYVDTEQIKYTSIAAGTMTVATGGRGWGGTTAATHADNAVMRKSHMLANGNDIAVYDMNGVKIPRWLGGMNTSTTQVWIAANCGKGISLTLDGAIASSGAVSSVPVKMTNANKLALQELTTKGATFLFAIGTEVFSGTGEDLSELTMTGTTRAVCGSSMAAHADGDTIRVLDLAHYIAYGDVNAGAVVQDETNKPIIELDSTNINWKFNYFFDAANLRAGSFQREVRLGKASQIVGGSHGASADPATEIGLVGNVYNVGGAPRMDTYDLRATLYHPAGFTTITANGDKYRYSVDFARVAGLYAGNNLLTGMYVVFNEATPGAAGTWSTYAWSKTSLSLGGTYNYIQFRCSGNVSGIASNQHIFEVQTIGGLAISSANILQLAFGSNASGCYEIGSEVTGTPGRITNTENSEYLDISFLGEVDQELKIDCNAEQVIYLKDNTRADGAVDYPVRDTMFKFIPGTDGVNSLQWVDANTVGMTISIEWEDRNS